MNEFELIRLLTRSLPSNRTVKAGPGDDCAVLDLGLSEQFVLFKADAVVEGVHFDSDTPPEKTGHKALARALSDIAAMAGTPVAALVTLGLPKDFEPAFIEAIYSGMNRLAARYEVAVAGGETTLNPAGIFLSIAVLGTVARDKCILRSGCRVGDAIFVTGELGGSILGKHLEFEPRLAEARWLADHFRIHAMIDLSDGLAGDLRHLLRASKVGAELLTEAIPISRAAKRRAAEGNGKRALEAALTDGEDFELLFTLASADAVRLLDTWKGAFPNVRIGCIGKIMAGEGLILRDKKSAKPLGDHGYTHFS